MADTPNEPDDEPPADRGDEQAATRSDGPAERRQGPENDRAGEAATAGTGSDDAAVATTATVADEDDVSRRWLIRVLIGLGIGIPVLIEGATLVRMLRSFLLGGDGGGSDGTDGGGTPDTTVAIGDEILPETPQSETLSRAVVIAGENVWEFEARIRIENTGDSPYTFRVSAITTEEGNRIADPASTAKIPPGGTTTIEHTWRLPAGESPAVMSVVGSTDTDAATERVEREVELGPIPIRN